MSKKAMESLLVDKADFEQLLGRTISDEKWGNLVDELDDYIATELDNRLSELVDEMGDEGDDD
jgi:hypothetical protein